jgi:hypothetical protein
VFHPFSLLTPLFLAIPIAFFKVSQCIRVAFSWKTRIIIANYASKTITPDQPWPQELEADQGDNVDILFSSETIDRTIAFLGRCLHKKEGRRVSYPLVSGNMVSYDRTIIAEQRMLFFL